MSALNPAKLYVRYWLPATAVGPLSPRRYTLTHSDWTGMLFLTVGTDYAREQITGFYTRLMRDEVLAEWRADDAVASLHVYCHVSGGLTVGSAAWRYGILRKHMPQVLQAFRHGDAPFFAAHPELDAAPIIVHFKATQQEYNRQEEWGSPVNYILSEVHVAV